VKLRRVKIDDIKVPEVRVTARMDEETAEQFAESVKAVGIDEPPKVYEVDGVFYLSDGKHRLDAAKALGETYIEVIVRPGTIVDVIANNLMAGHLRGKHPVSEMVRSIRLLYVEHHLGIEDIVKKTGLTQSYVEKLITLSTLTPLIQESLHESWLGVGRAAALTKIKDPILQESVFHQLKAGKWSVADVAAYVDDVIGIRDKQEEGVPSVQTIVPAIIHCFYCGEEAPPGIMTNPNTCPACQLAMLQSLALARAELKAEVEAKNKSQSAT